MRTRVLIGLLSALPAWAAADDASELLAKARAAFRLNLGREKYWNWTSVETRWMDRSGVATQRFPRVASESVILGEGRRCNAVTAWGDGHAAYLKDADPADRCTAYNAIGTPFDVALLLNSAKATVATHAADFITINVQPDKSRQKDADYSVRCAASIQATIQLDAASFFPSRIEGRVEDSGCNGSFKPVMHETPLTREPMQSNFRKGSVFRVEYSLQKDRFENAANSFWIPTLQRYDNPMNQDAEVLYYWGRQFPVIRRGPRLIKEVITKAQEFGAGSTLTFK